MSLYLCINLHMLTISTTQAVGKESTLGHARSVLNKESAGSRLSITARGCYAVKQLEKVRDFGFGSLPVKANIQTGSKN